VSFKDFSSHSGFPKYFGIFKYIQHAESQMKHWWAIYAQHDTTTAGWQLPRP